MTKLGNPEHLPNWLKASITAADRIPLVMEWLVRQIDSAKEPNRSGIAGTLHQLGRLSEIEDNPAEAARLFREALATFEKLGSPDADVARRSLMRVEGKSS